MRHAVPPCMKTSTEFRTTDGARTYTARVHYTTPGNVRISTVVHDGVTAYAMAERLARDGCTAIGVVTGLPGVPQARLAT